MTTSVVPDPRWVEWATANAPLLTSWQAFVLVLSVPAIAWGHEVARAWQERLTVSKILTEGKPGTLVMTRREHGRKKSVLFVLVGDEDIIPARLMLERWNP